MERRYLLLKPLLQWKKAYLHLTFEFLHRVVFDVVEMFVLNSQKDDFKIIEPNFIIFSIVIILIVLAYVAI